VSLVSELPPERAGYPAPPELAAQRVALAAAVASGVWQTEPAAEPIDLAGVLVLRFRAPGKPRGTVLHFHGGGFRLGCPQQVGPFAAALAARCEVNVICPAYRLAPEHPFPAGLNDGWAVAKALISSGAKPLILSGDSAGGGIAAGVAALVQSAGLVLLSPWLDLTVSSRSYRAHATSDPLFSTQSASAAAALYLQGTAADHPLASPLHGPVVGFPPTLINAGTGEVLADDARKMYSALLAAGIDAQLLMIEAMDHVAVTRGMDLPGSAETFAALANFIANIVDLDGKST